MNDDDREAHDEMQANMQDTLTQLGCSVQLAANLATMFAGLGIRNMQLGTVAEWHAVLYLLDSCTPPPGRAATIIGAMRVAAREQILKAIGSQLDHELVLAPLRLALAGEWEAFEQKVSENQASRAEARIEVKSDAGQAN